MTRRSVKIFNHYYVKLARFTLPGRSDVICNFTGFLLEVDSNPGRCNNLVFITVTVYLKSEDKS